MEPYTIDPDSGGNSANIFANINDAINQLVLGASTVQGRPIELRLSAGKVHYMTGAILDATLTASSLDIAATTSADGQTTKLVVADGAAAGQLLDVRPGAPPVNLRGLHLSGQLRIEGGNILVDYCRFGPASQNASTAGSAGRRLSDGGTVAAPRALNIHGGEVLLNEAVFEDCLGGAINVSGGKLRLLGGTLRRNRAECGGAILVSGTGEVEVHGATLEDNTANVSGGAIHVAQGGTLLLSNQTKINSSMPASQRLGFRGWSVYAEQGVAWKYRLPAPLAHYVTNVGIDGTATMERAIDLDYPYECGATLYGNSFDEYEQSGPQCSGSCPPGFFCAKQTIKPEPCREGTYCPEGSPAERQCPPGSYQPYSQRTSLKDCKHTKPGTYAAAGSPQPKNCSEGTAQPLGNQGLCDQCAAGRFQAREGATACDACQPGFYCPLGASEARPCSAGTYTVATDLSSVDDCTPCPQGYFCERGTHVPTPCPMKKFGGDVRLVAAAACTTCPGDTTSLPGQSVCRFCEQGFYKTGEIAATGRATCSASMCVSTALFGNGATCAASTTSSAAAAADALLTAMNLSSSSTAVSERSAAIVIAERVQELAAPLAHGSNSLARVDISKGHWRLSGRATTLYKCCGATCAGGTDGGDEGDYTGSGYCVAGHTGPLCQVWLWPYIESPTLRHHASPIGVPRSAAAAAGVQAEQQR